MFTRTVCTELVLDTSPQEMVRAWSADVSLGPLWMLTFHPIAGIPLVTSVTAEITLAFPISSARMSCSGYRTLPSLLQLPASICVGCMLFGISPISENCTISVLLLGSQLSSAVLLGLCFSVA